MNRKFLFIVLFSLAIGHLSCASSDKKPSALLGTIQYIELEGGFYGIIGDDGRKFDPVNLPEKFEKDGLKVQFWPAPFEGFTSFHMWGELVELKKIKKL